MKKQKTQGRSGQNQPQRESDELATAIHRANQGDKSGLAIVRQLLKDCPPGWIDFLEGDLVRHAEMKLIDRIAGNQLAFREALIAKQKALRTELAGKNPSPIERLMVERVVACWLQLASADVADIQAEKMSISQNEHLQRRQERAHRRYLSAIKMLAMVRKLALPIRVDVNVAGSIETKAAETTPTTRPRWLPEFADN